VALSIFKESNMTFIYRLFDTVHQQLTKQYLQFLCTPTGSTLGDLLQLFDSLTEVCHPLDHCHGGWNCVATPAAREDAWGKEERVYTSYSLKVQAV